MDRVFEHGGTSFRWDESKAAENQRNHGVSFEEAATVFDDPLFVLQDASRNEEQRDAVIGFSSAGRLLTWCTSSSKQNSSESSQRGVPRRLRRHFMINERVKKRLKKDRPSTTITMRIPADVVESLKAVAPMRGFTAYQTLLKSYISEGLRRDEAQVDQHTARRLAEALKRRGVAERVLQEAMKEIAGS
jgi:uncharacterized DUF497 family protein